MSLFQQQKWRNDMATEKNWLRTYTLKAGKQGTKGFEIGNTGDVDQTVLHISFSCEKSDKESANTAKVQIWNLASKNLKILEKKDCMVELKAGYGTNRALIFAGNVTSAVTTMDGADRLTELQVTDGRVALRDAKMKISLNGVVSAKTIYGMIAGQMGLSIKYAKGLPFKNFPNGYSFIGKGRICLKKMARACGHVWSIQNGVIQITKKGTPVSTKGYLLSHDTGLISIPKRITISQNSESKKDQVGYEIQYFLNGAIGVNDTVKIKTEDVNGYFRVYKVTLDGDNMEGDWICTAQVIEV